MQLNHGFMIILKIISAGDIKLIRRESIRPISFMHIKIFWPMPFSGFVPLRNLLREDPSSNQM